MIRIRVWHKGLGNPYLPVVLLANVGTSAALYTSLLSLIPRASIAASVTRHASTTLAIVASVGAVAAMVTNIIIGLLSDHRMKHHGTRRLWAVVGMMIGTSALLASSIAHSLAALIIAWVFVQLGINCMLAVITAYIPDHVPIRSRGAVSGWFALAQSLGLVFGLLVVSTVVQGVTTGYVFLSISFLLLALPFALTASPVVQPHITQSSDTTPLPSVLIRRNFRNTWLLRFVATLANSIAPLYVLLYLKHLHVAKPELAELLIIVIIIVALIPSLILFGARSDRKGRRKYYVGIALITMTVAYVVLALSHSFPPLLVFGALFGGGYGIYLSVDQALVADTLPTRERFGRDLGIVNIANSAPQFVAPAIGGLIIASPAGYSGLFWLVAVILLLALVPLARIRGLS